MYCQCGLGVKGVDIDYLRTIAEASDGGRRCVLAAGKRHPRFIFFALKGLALKNEQPSGLLGTAL